MKTINETHQGERIRYTMPEDVFVEVMAGFAWATQKSRGRRFKISMRDVLCDLTPEQRRKVQVVPA